MLDFERFRRVHKPVSTFTTVLGIVLGAATVLVAALISDSRLLPVCLLLASVVLGMTYIVGVHVLYHAVFPSGVPWPPDSETISPKHYGKVARSYLWRYSKSLAASYGVMMVTYLLWLDLA